MSCCQQVDDFLNRMIGFFVRLFQSAVMEHAKMVGTILEETVGHRSTKPFVKEDEEQGGFDAFIGESI